MDGFSVLLPILVYQILIQRNFDVFVFFFECCAPFLGFVWLSNTASKVLVIFDRFALVV